MLETSPCWCFSFYIFSGSAKQRGESITLQNQPKLLEELLDMLFENFQCIAAAHMSTLGSLQRVSVSAIPVNFRTSIGKIVIGSWAIHSQLSQYLVNFQQPKSFCVKLSNTLKTLRSPENHPFFYLSYCLKRFHVCANSVQ